MGILHNGYCFVDGQKAIDSFNSEVHRFFGVDSGFGEMHVHSDFGIYMHYYPVTGNGPPHQFTGHYLPTCTTPGTIKPTETFDPSNINPVDAASSIGSGFLLIAVPLAVVWAGRHFLRPLFNA